MSVLLRTDKLERPTILTYKTDKSISYIKYDALVLFVTNSWKNFCCIGNIEWLFLMSRAKNFMNIQYQNSYQTIYHKWGARVRPGNFLAAGCHLGLFGYGLEIYPEQLDTNGPLITSCCKGIFNVHLSFVFLIGI